MSKWVGVSARLHHLLGLAYYLYGWVVLFGGITLLSSIPAYLFSPSIFGVLVAVGLVAILAGIYLWMRATRHRLGAANTGIKILKEEVCYTVIGERRYQFGKELEIKALLPAVENYKYKFLWSSNGPITVDHCTEGATVQIIKDKKSNYNIAKVQFDKPITKQQKRTFAFALGLYDSDNKASPFISAHCIDTAELIAIKVIFQNGQEKFPRQFSREIFMSPAALVPIFEEIISVASHVPMFSWDIKRPRLNYVYRISWDTP